jgi:DNA-binding XRE family transcriptional regulator
MARPKVEVREIPCKRFNQILEETKVSQKWLSEHIFISVQTISGMKHGSANVSSETARRIVQIFPQYSYEWLMGYTDYKNQSEKFGALISEGQNEADLLLRGLIAFAKLTGYKIGLKSPAHGPNETSASAENWVKMFRDGYTIQKDGQTVNLSLEEMNLFENEVCDFVELKLKHLLKQKGDKNNG